MVIMNLKERASALRDLAKRAKNDHYADSARRTADILEQDICYSIEAIVALNTALSDISTERGWDNAAWIREMAAITREEATC